MNRYANSILRYPLFKVMLNHLLEWVAFLLLWPLLLRSKKCGTGPFRVLLVEPFGLGDVLSLSVMLDPLTESGKVSEIYVYVHEKNRDVYKNDQRVNRIITAEFPWSESYGHKHGTWKKWCSVWRSIQEVRKLSPDVGIDTRGDVRSQILTVLAGCSCRAGFRNYLITSNMRCQGLLLNKDAGILPLLHRYEANLHLLKSALGIHGALRFPSYPHRTGFEKPSGRLIVIHPGGGWIYKQWPQACWEQLIQKLLQHADWNVLLVGAASEKAIIQTLSRGKGSHCRSEVTDFNTLADYISSADLFIGLDSGPMNLAVAMNIKVLALFGPGEPDRWRPLNRGSRFLHQQFPCDPCLQKKCYYPGANCMTAISVDSVYETAVRMMADTE
jgi:ADP-heptose:LPS heptosyltransferase